MPFDVSNTGGRGGATAAQIYVADEHSPAPHPPKQSEGFPTVDIKPGETQHVAVPLNAHAFACYDTHAKHWAIAPGSFGILVGESSAQIDLTGSLRFPVQR